MVTPPLFELDNGRYSILRLLGAGHFGEVYEGFDKDQGEQVAIKIFKTGVIVDEVVREATNQAKLRGHDHIVDLRNVRPVPPAFFMVMEYLPEGSVRARFDAGQANLIEVVRWIRNALDGLTYAHSQGILHRDFKPANLMLATNGTAKLSDFGISEDTIKGQLVGKMYGALCAPEFISGGPSSVQTDIWAVGCSLYYLLTGKYPFGMPADPAAVAASRFQTIHGTNAQVPMSVVRVVEKALTVDLSVRYSSSRAMLSELLDCAVHRAWRPLADPDVIESWETCDSWTPLRASVSKAKPAKRGGYDVVIKRLTPAGDWRALPGKKWAKTEGIARRTLGNEIRKHVQTRLEQ